MKMRQSRQAIKDIITMVLLGTVCFFLSIRFQLVDQFVEAMYRNRASQVVTWIPLLVIIAVFYSVFIFRRWRETERANAKLLMLSTLDDLTGIYNRRGFLVHAGQRLERAAASKRTMALIFADLDDLKWINDTYGHQEGDKALRTIAHMFKHTFHNTDVVARLGGDEFSILTSDASPDRLQAIMQKLEQEIARYNSQRSRNNSLSISYGIILYDPSSPCSISELLIKADARMYEQKQQKKHNPSLSAHQSLTNAL